MQKWDPKICTKVFVGLFSAHSTTSNEAKVRKMSFLSWEQIRANDGRIISQYLASVNPFFIE